MIIVLYTFLFFNFMILSVVRSEHFIIKIKENQRKKDMKDKKRINLEYQRKILKRAN